MGKNIKVASFEEMGSTAAKLREASENYTRLYKMLLQEAETMGTAWEGADNQAFVEQIKGFTEELQFMAKKLMIAGETLDAQKQNYIDRQDANITQVKKLTN